MLHINTNFHKRKFKKKIHITLMTFCKTEVTNEMEKEQKCHSLLFCLCTLFEALQQRY